MKVWLIREADDPYEPWDVIGVFSTLEKAIEYKKKSYGIYDYNVCVEEWEINKVDEDEG